MSKSNNLSNETEAVSGRRIASFFGVEDPNVYGPAQLLRAQTAIRQLPELLSKSASLRLSPGESLSRTSNALAEWLCGMQARKAGELAGWPEDRSFDSFIRLDVATSIGSPEVYDLLFIEQEKPDSSL